MNESVSLQAIGQDIWLMSYPLRMLGADLRRNVTLLRLESGKLIIHSTAPFSSGDVATIRTLGDPAWLVDALLRHDTFAKEGAAAFPEAEYLAPPGFSGMAGVTAGLLYPGPAEWAGEVEVLPVEGAPAYSEIVMFHRKSGTLIVGDLIVHFSDRPGWWTRLLMTAGTVGGRYQPGVTRPLKRAIEREEDFTRSVETILKWDFERIIVGHGAPVASDAKGKLRRALQSAGVI